MTTRNTQYKSAQKKFVPFYKQLQEIEVIKYRIKEEITPRKTRDDYYDIIDAIVNDKDGLDSFRVRRVLQECLQKTEENIQDDVKKLLCNDLKCIPPSVESVVSQPTKIASSPSLPLKKSNLPKNFIPGRNTLARATRSSCCQPVFPRYQDLSRTPPQTKSSVSVQTVTSASVQTVISGKDSYQYSSVANGQSTILTENFMAKAEKFGSSLSSKPSLHSPKDKYFHCAVPLSEPCRNRPIFHKGKEDIKTCVPISHHFIAEGSTNALIVNVDSTKTSKPHLVEQKLPGVHIEGKAFQPIFVKNTEFISIVDEQNSPDAKNSHSQNIEVQKVTQPMSTHNELICPPEVEQNDVESDTISGQTTPIVRSTVLGDIINALMRSHKEIDRYDGSPTVTKLNINVSSSPTESENDLNLETNVEVEVSKANQADEGDLQSVEPKYQSTSVQTSPSRNLGFSKFESISIERIPSRENSSQTDLCGNMEQELIFEKNENLCASCGAVTRLLCIAQRTSTPNSDAGIVTSPHFTDGNLISFDEPIVTTVEHKETQADDNVTLKTHDVGIQLVCDTECQTHPEMKDVASQAVCLPPSASESTMTVHVESQHMCVQTVAIETPVSQGTQVDDQLNQDIQIRIPNPIMEISSGSDSVANPTSDSEFIDDLLSEGEVRLPLNLRLMSQTDEISPRNIQSSEMSNESIEENILSEGEIPPVLLQYITNLKQRYQNLARTAADRGILPDSFLHTSFSISPNSQGEISPDLSKGEIPFNINSSSSSELVPVSSSEELAHSESDSSGSGPPVISEPQRYHMGILSTSHNSRIHESCTTEQDSFYKRLADFLSSKDACSSSMIQSSGKPAVSKAPDLNTVIEESRLSREGNNAYLNQ